MKRVPNPVLPEGVLKFHCCNCRKEIESFYGRWGDGGTCSRKCDREMEEKPKEYRDDQGTLH